MDHIDHLASSRQIGKEQYVRAMEHLEFQNSKNASKLVEEGIQQGLFPVTARLHTYRDFDEHYYYQKISGHSSWFARVYDEMQSWN